MESTPFIKEAKLLNSKNEITSTLLFGEPFSICLKIIAGANYDHIDPLIGVNTNDNTRIFTSISSDQKISYSVKKNSEKIITVFIEEKLTPGIYRLVFGLRSGRNWLYDFIDNAIKMTISEQVYQDTVPNEKIWGFIRPHAKWN